MDELSRRDALRLAAAGAVGAGAAIVVKRGPLPPRSPIVLTRTSALGVVLGLVATVAAGSYAPPDQRREERREQAVERSAQQGVRAAQEKLQEARRGWQRAQEAASRVRVEERKASDRISRVREELKGRHEGAAGIPAVREARRAAQEGFERLRAPVLAALLDRPDYREALRASEAAKAELSILADDWSLPPDERARRSKAAADALLLPGHLERAAIDADAVAKAARDRATRADAALSDAKKKLDRMVSDDPAMREALDASGKARSELESTNRRVELEGRQADDAARALAREQAQLGRLQQQDRLDDLKDRQQQQKKHNPARKRR